MKEEENWISFLLPIIIPTAIVVLVVWFFQLFALLSANSEPNKLVYAVAVANVTFASLTFGISRQPIFVKRADEKDQGKMFRYGIEFVSLSFLLIALSAALYFGRTESLSVHDHPLIVFTKTGINWVLSLVILGICFFDVRIVIRLFRVIRRFEKMNYK